MHICTYTYQTYIQKRSQGKSSPDSPHSDSKTETAGESRSGGDSKSEAADQRVKVRHHQANHQAINGMGSVQL